MPITVNADNLTSVLQQYAVLTGKGIPELMRSNARLCAVQLANRTQPFSVGKISEAGSEAKKAGETRTTNDIEKIIKSRNRLDEIFAKTRSQNLHDELLKLANAGKWADLKAVFMKVGFVTIEFISNQHEFKTAHKYNRSRNTGRTFKKADKLYIAASGLPAYIAEVVKRVGLSKSGWAECARKIGGVKGDGARGIPAFAKRHHAGYGEVTENLAGEKTSFTLTNTIPWANKVCTPSEQRKALTIAKTNMIAQMRRAIKAAAKPKTDMKNIISEEVAKAA